ncbi:MAG: hypothetical protein WCI51_00355 [Lentisphaerota bacterium]
MSVNKTVNLTPAGRFAKNKLAKPPPEHNAQNLFGIFRETCQVYFLTAPLCGIAQSRIRLNHEIHELEGLSIKTGKSCSNNSGNYFLSFRFFDDLPQAGLKRLFLPYSQIIVINEFIMFMEADYDGQVCLPQLRAEI